MLGIDGSLGLEAEDTRTLLEALARLVDVVVDSERDAHVDAGVLLALGFGAHTGALGSTERMSAVEVLELGVSRINVEELVLLVRGENLVRGGENPS